ncbi:catechol 2,3-dioxygenase [Deinobacterium chartae]|uniref:Catechol 2,3-dioxygenase n=1 Tax=Deinobacterium chartae TaxID=521158 RepID=A0A841I1C8_9DEIO|nr:3,4-dihydroxyphenylacetate 2,3-dioxygenase [Deinobacterium chartae]MBB6099033.1 catechol 2,3-dioxygenase [Deinobacterium chartae]
MPILPASPTDFNIIRSAYAELTVTDLEASRAHYVDLLGLVESARTEDALYLRALEERQHHCLVLRQAQRPAVNALGFKVSCEEDLGRLEAHFRRLGLPAVYVQKEFQGRTLRARDPQGMPLEFFHRMDPVERMLQRFDLYRGAHVMRIDHLNCMVADVQAAHDFYARQLGFRVSEYTETDAADPQLWAAWMHRKGNVHDLALMNGDGPRLHHVGMWVENGLDLIRICDIFAAAHLTDRLERGPGRHGLSNAMFLYVRDPDGHRTELYTGDYQTMDPDFEPIRWSVNDVRRQTFWGHKAPECWFLEASEFVWNGEPVPRQPARLSERPAIAT